MNNWARDLLHEDAADVEFVEVMLVNDLEHPVHQAVVMAWDPSVGPVFELVQQNGSGMGPSFCKYAVVVDPMEAAGFPKDMSLRMPIGCRVNISMKYGRVYDPDEITFPLGTGGQMPRYLKILHQLVKREHLLIGSLAWADQPPEVWTDCEQGLVTGRTFSVRVVDIGFNHETQKGGLIVQCGLLRGFVPGGLVDFRSHFYGMTLEEILRSMVGKTIKVKAIKVDREDKQLIFSEVAAQDEIRRAQKADFLASVRVGDELIGYVTNIQPSLGIFVRVGNCCDGLVRPENLIGEAPELHQPVTVEVISVNLERGHLNLRLDHKFELEALDEETFFDLGALDYEVGEDFPLSVLDEVEPDLSALDS